MINMEDQKFQSFCQLDIPHPSDNNLTANLKTVDYKIIKNYWKISMFITDPESNEPIEKDTITYSSV